MQMAVAVEVTGGESLGIGGGGVDARGLEGAVVVAGQEAEVVAAAVGDDQVLLAVAAEVADADGHGLLVGGPVGELAEGAVAVAYQDAEVVAGELAIGGDDVQVAVA